MKMTASCETLARVPGDSDIMVKEVATSSPIRVSNYNMLEKLIAAEKVAENLRNNLSLLIQEFTEESKNDSSMSSLALDVSKISVLKVPETPICQFASSPNLSGISAPDGFNKTRMRRYESVSTSNLVKSAPKERKLSGLRRISPNIFKKKDAPSIKVDKVKSQDIKSKLHGLFKPKVITPSPSARSPKVGGPQPSPNPSISSRKKYSHIKSTIPRPAKKE